MNLFKITICASIILSLSAAAFAQQPSTSEVSFKNAFEKSGEQNCFKEMREIENGVNLYLMENPGASDITIGTLVEKKYIAPKTALKCPVFPDKFYALEWSGGGSFKLFCPGHGKDIKQLKAIYGKKQVKKSAADMQSAQTQKQAAAVTPAQSTQPADVTDDKGQKAFYEIVRHGSLMESLAKGDLVRAKALIKEGVAKNISPDGKTALQLAKEKGYSEIVDMLHRAGHTK
jgi:hypothetical protein